MRNNRNVDILIAGNGGVALSAIRTIRNRDNNVKVFIISKEKESFYAPVLLPYYISGKISRENLFPLNSDFYKRKSIDILIGREVKRINAQNKKVLLDDGSLVAYEKLIIGTGASPFIPSIEGIGNRGVFSLRTVKDADSLLEHLPGKVVIIGAGAVAISVAIALRKRGADVSVIYRKDISHIIGGRTGVDISKEVVRILEKNGIQFFFNQDPLKMQIYGDPIRGIKGKDMDLRCNAIVVAAGVRPNTDFVDREEISLGAKRGILVDDRMMSSNQNIYAAGDCVEAVNFITGEKENNPIWPNAIEQGRVAAMNALGIDYRYQGFIKKNVINLFDQCLFIAGEMGEERKSYKERGKACCLATKDGTVTGCQVLGISEKFGIYFEIIKNRYKIDQINSKAKRQNVLNLSWIMFKKEILKTA